MIDKTEEFDEVKEQLKTILEKEQSQLPPKSAPLIEKTAIRMMKEDLSLKEALGFPQEMIEEIYENGYHLFKSGKFKEALPVFNVLRQLEGTDPRFTFAIAACHHQMKNYVDAAGNYILYQTLEPKNPLSYYHLYDCFIKMNQPSLAFNALQLAEKFAIADPQYAELAGKIELELAQQRSLNV